MLMADTLSKKKRKKKNEDFVIEDDGDHPVHEKYVELADVKQ